MLRFPSDHSSTGVALTPSLSLRRTVNKSTFVAEPDAEEAILQVSFTPIRAAVESVRTYHHSNEVPSVGPPVTVLLYHVDASKLGLGIHRPQSARGLSLRESVKLEPELR